MLTIILVVVIGAIVVLFSQEFAELFKKLFTIYWVLLLLPLLLATAFIVYYEPWVYAALLSIQSFLLHLINLLASVLPFKMGANLVITVLLLVLLSCLPVLLINLWFKRKRHHNFEYSYLTSTIIWLITTVLLVVSYIN